MNTCPYCGGAISAADKRWHSSNTDGGRDQVAKEVAEDFFVDLSAKYTQATMEDWQALMIQAVLFVGLRLSTAIERGKPDE
jgi:hypothetical protein